MEAKKLTKKIFQRDAANTFLNYMNAKKNFRELVRKNQKIQAFTAPPDDYCQGCSHYLECGDYERQNCPFYENDEPEQK